MIEFIEITDIEKFSDTKCVYDLTVSNNHTYIANDYIVHNCITSSNTSSKASVIVLLFPSVC